MFSNINSKYIGFILVHKQSWISIAKITFVSTVSASQYISPAIFITSKSSIWLYFNGHRPLFVPDSNGVVQIVLYWYDFPILFPC